MPFFLIPMLIGAGGTGYWWYSSSQAKEPTFSGELFNTLKPFLIMIVVVLLLRWLYVKGIQNKKSK